MPEELIGVKTKEKLLLRIFTRSIGPIVSHTFETQEELVKKFLPDQTNVIHYVGVDDFDQPVEHWFESSGKGDIAGIVIVPLKDRKIMPVEVQPTGQTSGPRRMPGR